jgi:hypothetical protein
MSRCWSSPIATAPWESIACHPALLVVQRDSEQRLDRAVAYSWFRRDAAVLTQEIAISLWNRSGRVQCRRRVRKARSRGASRGSISPLTQLGPQGVQAVYVALSSQKPALGDGVNGAASPEVEGAGTVPVRETPRSAAPLSLALSADLAHPAAAVEVDALVVPSSRGLTHGRSTSETKAFRRGSKGSPALDSGTAHRGP